MLESKMTQLYNEVTQEADVVDTHKLITLLREFTLRVTVIEG
jgi:hypothetical protein